MAGMMGLPAEYTAVLERAKAEQAALGKLIATQQQYETQRHENEMVQQALLDNPSTVYKLFGRVMVRQDVGEAKSTVDRRLEFINGEIARVDASIKEQQGKLATSKKELGEAQKKISQVA